MCITVLFLKKKVDTVPTNGYWPASFRGAESKYYKILGGGRGLRCPREKECRGKIWTTWGLLKPQGVAPFQSGGV